MKVLHRAGVPLVSLLSLGAVAAAQSTPGAPGARPMAGFSTAVAVSGEELFVGRTGEFAIFPAPATELGAVHVFRREAGRWAEVAAVTTDDAGVGDGFAASLAASGNVLLVGAFKRAGARGAAYVFERSGARAPWRMTARLDAADGAAGDSLGFAVAVRGDLALVGAPGHGAAGAAYVFHRGADGTWEQHHILTGGGDGGRFGASVALGDAGALVGAPGPHATLPILGPPPAYAAGSAFSFRHDMRAGGWVEEARLTAPDSGVVTFGAQVLLSDLGAFVSAPAANQTGAVFQFRRATGGAWQPAATIAPGRMNPTALVGASMALSGRDLLVGAPAAQGTGAVVVMRRGDTGWTEAQRVPFQGTGFLPLFGLAVAADGDLAVLGAPGADFFEGTGYVFARNAEGTWSGSGSIIETGGGLEPVAGGQVDCTDGAAGQFTCRDVDLVAFLPTRSLGARRGVMVNDLWGWTDPETNKEYAIVGRFDGTAFVDLSDPANPVYLGDLPLHDGATPNLWRDMKVYRNHVYIVADGAGPHGVQVFDLTRLRAVTNPPATFEETAHYDGIHSAHNIVIDEETGFAYTVGNGMGGETCGGGLHMIDIRDPEHPTFAGCYADPETGNAGTGYTHDAQCTVYHGPDAEYAGREICFNASETALGIADVTDKDNPRSVSRGAYPNVGYTHQGWISEDHKYFFVDDELDELEGHVSRTRTLVWDIEDLDDPVLLTEYMGETSASDHNLYVRGHYLYESNYVAGLRIIDIADPAHPREVAYFDTVPWGDDAPGFAGSWSNYPFFASGVVVVSSMREGLFILKKREQRPIP